MRYINFTKWNLNQGDAVNFSLSLTQQATMWNVTEKDLDGFQ
ncbi:hypothetical protein B4088_0962 [Bacillus cereus]|uniref:Uncharacterized protein n=1 Tax=Bacillus cereus TaxID=1396 RepID=A0A162PDH2_BACCE|nr:hypothetical protein B4088_0962 [Bacillus cereus]